MQFPNGKFSRPGQPSPIIESDSAQRRRCPHCRIYVFPIRDFFFSGISAKTLKCRRCGKASYASKKTIGLIGSATIATVLFANFALRRVPGLEEWLTFCIAVALAVPARFIACHVLAEVQLGKPVETWNDEQQRQASSHAVGGVRADNIADVFKRVDDKRSALLFGPDPSEWLWLTRRDQTYCIQLTMYPKPLKALRPAFENALRKLGTTIEMQKKDRKDTLVCRLGYDPEVAGEKAWAIFTDTMGLPRDASVAMKWL